MQKLLSIWLMVIGLIVVTAVITGVQVFWWQQATAKTEQQKLLQKINRLQNEIKLLKDNHGQLPQPITKPLGPPKNQSFQGLLAGKDARAIIALSQKDMQSLASLIHPVKGVRFSPYLSIDPKTDLVYNTAQLMVFFRDHRKHTWGYYEGTSTAIKLTNEEYYKLYLYDADYAHAVKTRLNPEPDNILITGNIFEVYPKGIVVEYRFPQDTNQNNTVWRSLKLVFEPEGKTCFLVGIIHDQW